MTTTTTIYSVNTVDSETWPAAFATAGVATVTPGAQDSGKCRFEVKIDATAHETFEAAMEADDAVIEYSVVEA